MKIELFATSNKNKLREFEHILGTKLRQADLSLSEAQAIDVEEVIGEKARSAYRLVGKPVLVEDTGLYIAAWNSFPGALVKWLLSAVGRTGIIRMLAMEKNREAFAKTAVGFYDGMEVHIFIGKVRGSIPNAARGESGFGWDPIFVPRGHSKTFAELGPKAKNRISMRSKALRKLKAYLESQPSPALLPRASQARRPGRPRLS